MLSDYFYTTPPASIGYLRRMSILMRAAPASNARRQLAIDLVADETLWLLLQGTRFFRLLLILAVLHISCIEL